MRIVIFGISGKAGSRIAREALNRGHSVIGVVRSTSHPPFEDPNLQLVTGNVLEPASVSAAVKGADAVVSAIGPGNFDRSPFLLDAAESLFHGLAAAGVKRLLIVGGAGSLEVAPGIQLVDTPKFPAPWKGIALAHRDAWDFIRKQTDLDWTYVAPAALLEPGQRTAHYRSGSDNLVIDTQGNSRISMEDYAVAVLDEIENPRHIRQRMSVGY